MTTHARTPMVLDVQELVGKPGAYERFRAEEPVEDAFGTEIVRILPGSSLDLDLLLESVREGILVTGSVRASGTSECSRCLDPVTVPLSAALQELYVWSAEDALPDENGERPEHLDGAELDLRPAVHDDLILAMPIAPVCRADCPGLCPRCGARLADEPDHSHATTDPRWDVLTDLRDRLRDEQPEATNEEN